MTALNKASTAVWVPVDNTWVIGKRVNGNMPRVPTIPTGNTCRIPVVLSRASDTWRGAALLPPSKQNRLYDTGHGKYAHFDPEHSPGARNSLV